MDQEKKPQLPNEDDWFDELLSPPAVGEELGPDENAVSAAGLTHPDDLEIDRIIQEAKALDGELDEDIPLREYEPILAPQEEVLPQLPLIPEEQLTTEAAETELPPEIFPEEIELPEDLFPDVEEILAETTDELPEQEPIMVPPVILEDMIEEEEPFPMPEEQPKEKPKRKVKENKTKKQKNAVGEINAEGEPVRKGRPKLKKGYGLLGIPHILSTLVWLAIILVIGISLGRTLWVCAADVLAFGRKDQSISVTIYENDDIESIAARLKSKGLIKYPTLFKLYADLTDAQEDIVPGTYTLNTLYDYHALVKSMNSYTSSRETIEVVIPEGYTCAQIFALLEEKGVCAAAELEAYAAEGDIKDYWFLEGVERGHKYCLEGYLFPDTYEFYVGDSAGRVLGKLLGDNVGGFEVRFTDLMKEKLTELNERLSDMMAANGYDQAYIDAHQMTFRDIVIIASMIEEETTGKDQHDISSVIYNRLTNAREHPYLNIDATIVYALGGNIDPETGKVKKLTSEDLKLDSPFNTYLYKGMIPGPITNPGIASLLAALDPNDTSYYFYVYNPSTGLHMFAETAAKHEENVKYVRSLDDE